MPGHFQMKISGMQIVFDLNKESGETVLRSGGLGSTTI